MCFTDSCTAFWMYQRCDTFTSSSSSYHRLYRERLGHIGNKKTQKLVKDKVIPAEAVKYRARDCKACSLTYPSRRSVPRTAERSNEVVVQVDYLPMEQGERGWEGETGAYIFTSRSSKIAKAYPVKDASTATALETLDQFCTKILPFLKEKVNCLQTDAGAQFKSDKCKGKCAKYKLRPRTCPVDYQAMNGQAACLTVNRNF